MKKFDSKAFVKERHAIFKAVLDNDDLKPLFAYCKKYGVPIPQREDVAIAGVCKAIQECTDFTEEEKEKAREKCIALDFTPYMDY